MRCEIEKGTEIKWMTRFIEICGGKILHRFDFVRVMRFISLLFCLAILAGIYRAS